MPVSQARRIVTAGAIAGSMLVGGVIGAVLYGASTISAAAATPSPTPSASASPGAGTFKSNEDPTHEQGESATREADENSGKAFAGGRGGPGGHGPNEDATHEAGESAAQEAAENARHSQAPTATPSPSA
jgi:hypothetical protein